MPKEPEHPDTPSTHNPASGHHSPAKPAQQEESKPCCETCGRPGAAGAPERPPEQFVFAVGKLDVRFPDVGMEREFQRCLRGTPGAASLRRGERLRKVLDANRHLAVRACYLFCVGSVPAYIVGPAASFVRDSMLDALTAADAPDNWVVLIGRIGPVSRPADCGGVLAPLVVADQVYTFTLDEWRQDLHAALKPALDAKRTTRDALATAAEELFNRAVTSMQNVGATDAHRALNFLLVRHPGLFLAVAERADRSTLERIETRLVHGLGPRRQVLVILTFLDLATAVPERLFCRVDVTEEWPFIADQPDGGAAPLGLQPFVESEMIASAF